jgi:hypothetical protein
MLDPGNSTTIPKCERCSRTLTAERPVRLPDKHVYCAACCESMAAADFEMETGELFTRWIEKHPELVMKYQPLELTVRRFGFFFPAVLSLLGLVVIGYGVALCIAQQNPPVPALFLLAGAAIPVGIGVLWLVYEKADWLSSRMIFSVVAFLFIATVPVYGLIGCVKYGFSFGYIVLGGTLVAFFGLLAAKGVQAYLRALNFNLTLKDGVFHLHHGNRTESFSVEDVTKACIVRPGTVGATEGALQLKDGRMLTLDTCLSDLHALGVVMDLRFREEFPPSADDLAKIRRDKLRKIRGLSD